LLTANLICDYFHSTVGNAQRTSSSHLLLRQNSILAHHIFFREQGLRGKQKKICKIHTVSLRSLRQYMYWGSKTLFVPVFPVVFPGFPVVSAFRSFQLSVVQAFGRSGFLPFRLSSRSGYSLIGTVPANYKEMKTEKLTKHSPRITYCKSNRLLKPQSETPN
jgi:hypothetical protein